MMSRALIAAALIFLAVVAPAMAQDPTLLQPGDTLVGYVLEVTDGDSLVVELRGLRMDVRLAGVNAPEWNQPGGEEATAFVEAWVERGRMVIMEAAQDCYTTKPDCWDRYGRMLAFIWRDGRMLQEDLLTAGRAEVKYIKPEAKYYTRLQAAKE